MRMCAHIFEWVVPLGVEVLGIGREMDQENGENCACSSHVMKRAPRDGSGGHVEFHCQDRQAHSTALHSAPSRTWHVMTTPPTVPSFSDPIQIIRRWQPLQESIDPQ